VNQNSLTTEGTWSEVLKKRSNLTDYDHWVQKNNRQSNKSWMHQYEYARSALKLGIEQQEKLGINLFKFGMIGSTDIHTSLASANENNFLDSDPSSGSPAPIIFRHKKRLSSDVKVAAKKYPPQNMSSPGDDHEKALALSLTPLRSERQGPFFCA